MRLLLLTTAFAASLAASPLTVQVTGTSGISDSSGDQVLPYDITINGTPYHADCYDYFNPVQIGDTWSAQELTVSQAAATGQFSKDPDALQLYEEVAVLSAFQNSTAQQQIDVQHLMWDIFDPGAFPMDTAMQFDLVEAQGIVRAGDFNYANVIFIEAAPGNTAPYQDFVVDIAAPEPTTWGMALIGLVMVCLVWRRVA